MKKFVSFVASKHIGYTFLATVALPYVLGFILLLAGISTDNTMLSHIADTQGGMAALAYDVPERMDLFTFMVESVLGNCRHYGSCLQGLGFWLMLVVSPVVGGFALIVQFAERLTRKYEVKYEVVKV